MDYASGTNQVSSSPEFVEVDVLFLSGQPYTIGHDYRVDRYVQAARGCGLTVRWMDVASLEDVDIGRVKMLVIRRAPLNPGLLHVIDAARNGGAVILFDVDDLVFRPDLAESDLIDGPDGRKLTQEQTQELFLNMLQTLSNSDLVTCPTKELANHARRLGRPAFVLPDGFDEAWHSACRLAHRKQLGEDDGIIRIGYAAGSRMQQRDFAGVVESIARVLAENPNVRLVLFRDHSMQDGMATADEFPALKTLESQIEWRDLVPLTGLPAEIARFSINIVPLEKGNPLCESRSEVKFLEAALAGVPTIATATAPLLRAVAASSAGILAQSTDDWYAGLSTLIRDGEARRRLAQDAYHVSLAHFSPRQCLRRFKTMWDLTRGGELAAAAFQRNQYEEGQRRFTTPRIPGSTCLFMKDRLGQAAVTVIIPVYNYADYALEALQSVAEQTLDALDLVVVDDCSTDDSVAMILAWLRDNHTRFNRCVLLRHCQNMGLGPARNSGFAAAETRHVLPLDADNRLRRNACQMLLEHLDASPAGFAYPSILKFGDEGDIFGTAPFSILKLQCGNYIDAMALIRKEAWAASGGYDNVQYGWEDFDFWCRLIEGGWFGMSVGHVLAEYRVHGSSMLRTTTDKAEHREYLRVELTRRHPWLELPVTEEASPTIAD
jgi:GT2 family glycosyltransferase/glycosyltransferase involved in cell wall biosynthesis